ncbi:hypothetical protein BDZ91DRAFT_720550 [Kalaharituber pfeilii]|nr:hypothetical protein BDZ91DRAFT_720550 [Kalaharituber pfeilii]
MISSLLFKRACPCIPTSSPPTLQWAILEKTHGNSLPAFTTTDPIPSLRPSAPLQRRVPPHQPPHSALPSVPDLSPSTWVKRKILTLRNAK